ncbi:MAG: DUF3160 domain-containing protein [Acidobacteria bacterium]|nr:DUF3160 domain-containing protein [Acidobacteriota bacterium]
MKFIKLLVILLILLQLVISPIFAQNQNAEIIGLEVLQSDNQEVIAKIKEKGFALSLTSNKAIYSPYLNSPLPPYVTADSMLQTFHTLYRESVARIEEANADKLLTFLKLLAERTIGYLSIDIPEKNRIALERNLLVFQTLIALLEKNPSKTLLLVKEELRLIETASKIEQSPILRIKIDYRQFILPKGISEKRAKLFQALTWAENWQLNLNDELSSNQTFLLLQDFAVDERLVLFWKEIDQPFSYLFGTISSLDIEKTIPIIKYILGANPITVREISEDHLKTFQRLAIRSNPGNQVFKLLGKRITLKEKLQESFGNDFNVSQLDFAKIFKLEDTKNLKLRQTLLRWQMENPKNYLSELIGCFKALLYKKKDSNLPSFINTPEWENNLSTTISVSWLANQFIVTVPEKNNTVSEGSNRYNEDFHGYVEPNTEFFFALRKMSSTLQDTLIKMRIFISELDEFIKISSILEKIVIKELTATPLFEEEIDLLENFAEILAKVNFVVGNYQNADFDQSFILTLKNGSKSSNIIGGKILNLYIAVPYKNKIYLCQGVVSTYFEQTNLDDFLH